MPRRAPLVLLILLALAAFVLWLQWPDSAVQNGTAETTAAQPAAVDSADGSLANEEALPPAGDSIARSDAQVPAEPGAPVSRLLTVRVVEKPDGQPASGAEVLLRPPGGPAGVAVPERVSFQNASIDQQLEGWGRVFTCDEFGVAQVPLEDEGDFYVGARKAGLWGRVQVKPEQLDAEFVLVIELSSAIHLEVLVLDERRTPAADVPIAYRALRNGIGRSLQEARSGTDGIARLRHLQEEVFRHGSSDYEHVVAIGLPFASTVQAAFDPYDPPREPIVLVLPATGTVEVELLNAEGAPYTDRLSVALQRQMPTADRSRFGGGSGMINQDYLGLRWERVKDGVARFERVGLGLILECGSSFERSRELTSIIGFGPARAGETVRLVLQQTQPNPEFTGRLLQSDGAPLSSVLVDWTTFSSTAQRQVTSGNVTTDAEGGFQIPCSELAFASKVEILQLTPRTEKQRLDLAFATLPDPLPQAGADLGEIMIGTPVFVSGRVLAPDGSPDPSAYGNLQALDGKASAVARMLGDAQWHVDESGRFEVTGPLPAGRYRLTAWSTEHQDWRCTPVEFSSGDQDLEVPFHGITSVRGRLLVDSGLRVQDLELHLTTGSDGNQSGRSTMPSAEDGAFFLAAGASNLADFKVTAANGVIVWRQDGIALLEGATTDLGDIDLRGLLQETRLHLRGANGELIPKATIWKPWPGQPLLVMPSHESFPLSILNAPGAVVLLSAPGHLLTEIQLGGGEQTVTLAAGYAVMLHYGELPLGPEWGLRLEPVGSAGQLRVPFNLKIPCAAPSGSVRLELPIAGRWTVYLDRKTRSDWNGRVLEGWDPIPGAWGEPAPVIEVQISGALQEFRLTAEAAAIRSALEEQ